MLVRKELLSPEWVERILSRRHTGFNVHSLVRTKTKPEAERVGKYMIRPVLSLERLSFLEQGGKVGQIPIPAQAAGPGRDRPYPFDKYLHQGNPGLVG